MSKLSGCFCSEITDTKNTAVEQIAVWKSLKKVPSSTLMSLIATFFSASLPVRKLGALHHDYVRIWHCGARHGTFSGFSSLENDRPEEQDTHYGTSCGGFAYSSFRMYSQVE